MDNKLIPLGNTHIALAKTTTALALTNKLTFNQNRKLVKEIFKKNPQFFVDYISYFYPLNEQFLEKYSDEWNWECLSRNKFLPWKGEFIKRYRNKWNWKILSKSEYLPWSQELIKRYIRWDWQELSSGYTNLASS